MSKLKFSHLFVDFDGTLIDSIDNMYQAYIALLKHYGIVGTIEEAQSLNGPSTLEIVKIFKEKYSISDSFETIFERYKGLIKEKYFQSKPFDDSELFLSKAKEFGLKMTLVTSSHSELALPIIRKYGWDKLINSYIWGENVKNSKPSPEIYLLALKDSNIDKENVLVVEDSINGVISAHKAGLKVLGLSYEFSEAQLISSGALNVFKDLSAALNFLLKV